MSFTTYTLARRASCKECGHDIEHAGHGKWQDRRHRVRCYLIADDQHRPGRQWFRRRRTTV